MNRRNVRRLSWYGLMIMFGLMAIKPALAGGFQIGLEIPDPQAGGEWEGAVLVLRPYGCHQPNDATLSATAEGLVNGQRQSLAVPITRTSSPGVYAIKQNWPSEGHWVLSITGQMFNMTRGAIVKLGPGGTVHTEQLSRKAASDSKAKLSVPIADHKPTVTEINAALQSLSGQTGLRSQAAKVSK